MKISRVDVVVGLLAQCLSQVEPESKPIDTAFNVVNVRPFICPIRGSIYLFTAPRNGGCTQIMQWSTRSSGSSPIFRTQEMLDPETTSWFVRPKSLGKLKDRRSGQGTVTGCMG